MKNFNIYIYIFFFWGGGGEVHGKLIYRGDFLKRGDWTVCRFKGGLGKRKEAVFLKGGRWVDTPTQTMCVYG